MAVIYDNWWIWLCPFNRITKLKFEFKTKRSISIQFVLFELKLSNQVSANVTTEDSNQTQFIFTFHSFSQFKFSSHPQFIYFFRSSIWVLNSLLLNSKHHTILNSQLNSFLFSHLDSQFTSQLICSLIRQTQGTSQLTIPLKVKLWTHLSTLISFHNQTLNSQLNSFFLSHWNSQLNSQLISSLIPNTPLTFASTLNSFWVERCTAELWQIACFLLNRLSVKLKYFALSGLRNW